MPPGSPWHPGSRPAGETCSRASPKRPAGHTSPNVGARLRYCFVGLGQRGGGKVPAVPHLRPYLKLNIDKGAASFLRKPGSVVEQHFVIAHLDEHRWQTTQVSENG